jgi:hypothetical protein
MKKTKAEENFESSIEAMLIAWREVCEAKTSLAVNFPRLCRSAFLTTAAFEQCRICRFSNVAVTKRIAICDRQSSDWRYPRGNEC